MNDSHVAEAEQFLSVPLLNVFVTVPFAVSKPLEF